MSTIIRRQRLQRTFSLYRRHELLVGEVRYFNDYDGYGDGRSTRLSDFISPTMRHDWETHRDELMDFWHSGKSSAQYFTDHLPWLYVYFAAPTTRRPWALPYLEERR